MKNVPIPAPLWGLVQKRTNTAACDSPEKCCLAQWNFGWSLRMRLCRALLSLTETQNESPCTNHLQRVHFTLETFYTCGYLDLVCTMQIGSCITHNPGPGLGQLLGRKPFTLSLLGWLIASFVSSKGEQCQEFLASLDLASRALFS